MANQSFRTAGLILRPREKVRQVTYPVQEPLADTKLGIKEVEMEWCFMQMIVDTGSL